MAYRQPFRSGLKDLAQGLLQQAQAQQQQSQMEAQMKQQMAAQQAQTTAQVGQTMGSSVMQAAGVIGQGFENRRAEQVQLSEQALRDGRTKLDELLAQQAELRALHNSGVVIENFDSLNDGMTAYINSLSGALSGDVADIFKRLGELPGIEVAPGVLGSEALTAFNSALVGGRRMREMYDLEQGQFRAQVDTIVQQLWTMDPLNPVSVNQAMRAANTIQNLMRNNPDALPKGTNADFLREQIAIVQAAFEEDQLAQRLFNRSQQLLEAEQRDVIGGFEQRTLDMYRSWLNDGLFSEEFRPELEAVYNTQRLRDNDGNIMSFDEATAYNREASQQLVVGRRELERLGQEVGRVDLDLALKWKEFDANLARTEDAQSLIASLVAAGNVSGLLALSRDPVFAGKFPELANSVIPDRIAEASRIANVSRLSGEFAVMELQSAIETFPQDTEAERTARGTAALMAQAGVLGEAGLKTWWSQLDPNMKQFYGGQATFDAAVRDAQFMDYKRENDKIGVALQRLAPIMNSPKAPENIDAATAFMMSTLMDVYADEGYAMQVVASVRSAWETGDEEFISQQLRNTRLRLENDILRMDLQAAEFSLANPQAPTVDVNGFKQLLDTRRLNASSEHAMVMESMRANNCVPQYFTDSFGMTSQRGGENQGSKECVDLMEEETLVRYRMLEIDESIASLWNVAVGLPVSSRPAIVDNATRDYFVNAGASQFAVGYQTTGQLDMAAINQYAYDVLDGFNVSDQQRVQQQRLIVAAIASAILNNTYVNYGGTGQGP